MQPGRRYAGAVASESRHTWFARTYTPGSAGFGKKWPEHECWRYPPIAHSARTVKRVLLLESGSEQLFQHIARFPHAIFGFELLTQRDCILTVPGVFQERS
jgi:hypothetical protein